MVWLLGRMKCSASGAELPETSGTPTNHNLRDSAASAAEIRSGVRRVYALISYSDAMLGQAMPVNPGAREVVAEFPSGQFKKAVQLAEGQTETVTLQAPAGATPPPPPLAASLIGLLPASVVSAPPAPPGPP